MPNTISIPTAGVTESADPHAVRCSPSVSSCPSNAASESSSRVQVTLGVAIALGIPLLMSLGLLAWEHKKRIVAEGKPADGIMGLKYNVGKEPEARQMKYEMHTGEIMHELPPISRRM
jgi:hypothetical protein